ncbi:MAG: hypothetical protein GYB68_07315, partial [Chloroflexi bacterium]|nr:hypothetical protein [Chloroflexota bacterium]
ERLSRGAADLAGAQSPPFRIWLEDWTVEELSPGEYRMQVEADGIRLDLLMSDRKGPIFQGDQGYSRKGSDPGNASYYYSLTRLESEGSVWVEGQEFEISGWSWMDHEHSTSALDEDQIGWDWFAVQLENDTELMFYHVRRADGSIDALSKGIYVAEDGSTTLLSYADGDYNIEVLDTWRSPNSEAVYPAGWRVTLPTLDLVIEIDPLVVDQEMDVSTVYWEGAVEITATQGGNVLRGFGYVELTGYESSMEGRF